MVGEGGNMDRDRLVGKLPGMGLRVGSWVDRGGMVGKRSGMGLGDRVDMGLGGKVDTLGEVDRDGMVWAGK